MSCVIVESAPNIQKMMVKDMREETSSPEKRTVKSPVLTVYPIKNSSNN